MGPLVLIVPGSLETVSGGYAYDRRMVAGLRKRGWSVEVRELDDTFPRPTSAARDQAARVLAQVPDGTPVLIDGLALGAMPSEVEREAARLRLIALVHHPLAAETGIDLDTAVALEASERRALAAARLVVVTSRATAAALTRYGVGPDRIAVVVPGTDRAPLARGSQGATLQLLCVAALIPRKGHEVLFRSLAMMPDLEWRLTCAGSLTRDPSTAERLRARLRSEGLEDRVVLAGEVDTATLAGLYDGADVFVLPTLHEGYGMAVAEALARGLPVVGTATGAIADLLTCDVQPDAGAHAGAHASPRDARLQLDGVAGLLVPPGDHEALAAALALALGDAHVRDQLTHGARRVRDRLSSWEDASARLSEALEKGAGERVQR
jgi:glycosyltransferase involved in cell wall biosynthesis